MRARIFLAVVLGCSLVGSLWAAQRSFRQYPGVEYPSYDLPTDIHEPFEWVFARLMYPPARYGYRLSWGGDWAQGYSSWTIDYPRGDRHMADALKRLTRIQARSFEQPVNLDDGDDVFNWPWLYAVEVGTWQLTEAQVGRLREYLLRGGFLMVDDFHGTQEWSIFVASMQRVFPDRPIVEIGNEDAIFHTIWDLNDRVQVPGLQYVYTHRTYEKDGRQPHWRGIYDDKGRIMVAVCFNMDLGDSVEHSDNPRYPQEYSAQGMRTFLNYAIYSMTH